MKNDILFKLDSYKEEKPNSESTKKSDSEDSNQ